ncbi:MAG: hypothetical protein EOM67_09935 [Spirochaetia bacterium]|nr:hypothetical protein [Spirochaetia bacterium]
MKTISFRETVISHLGEYKKNVMGIPEKGEYNYKGIIKYYDHILPKESFKENILPQYREPFWKSCSIKRHRCFNHLNSSQALCFNFLYPLIQENRLDEIGNLLNIPLGKNCTSQFEFPSDIEGSFKQTLKTNFDFYISSKDSNIYFEIKYTETDFGRAKSDTNHIEKFYQVYKPLLDNNPYIRKECKTQDFFLKNYQIMRNIVHISEGNFVIFLVPEQNKNIYKQAKAVAEKILTDRESPLFRVALLEEWAKELTNIAGSNLQSYYTGFQEKYFPKHIPLAQE